MTSTQRIAIARILIDLIKADGVIHEQEVMNYTRMRTLYNISDREQYESYRITLSDAMNELITLSDSEKERLLEACHSISRSDGASPREESLLMLALTVMLGQPGCGAEAISVPRENAVFDPNQILYVESETDPQVNEVIRRDHRAISDALQVCGWNFVYIPFIADHYRHYQASSPAVLKDIIYMLAPQLSDDSRAQFIERIQNFDTAAFCRRQLFGKLKFPGMDTIGPALLIPVTGFRCSDSIYTCYLLIHVDEDICGTARRIADTFLQFISSSQMVISHKRDYGEKFLYSGIYRRFIDIMLIDQEESCTVIIDFVHEKILIKETRKEIVLPRKAKALYALFVCEMARGPVRLTPPRDTMQPSRAQQRYLSRMALLQERYAVIYKAFNGNPSQVPDITESTIRNPMISNIKRQIDHACASFNNRNDLKIQRDSNGDYRICAGRHQFLCTEWSDTNSHSIFESDLIRSLPTAEKI